MEDVLTRVCSIVSALACNENECSHSKVDEMTDGGDTIILKNVEFYYKALRKQSVSYVTTLSWSLLCEQGSGGPQRLDSDGRMELARDVISRYHDGMEDLDEAQEYILGLLLVHSIGIVCSASGDDEELMGQIRRALVGPIYHVLVDTPREDWMDLVVVFVEAVDVSRCWDVLIDIVRPCMERIRGACSEVHQDDERQVHMACVGLQKAGENSYVFLEYMHGEVFYAIVEYLKGEWHATLPLVLLHDIVQSVVAQGEEDAQRILSILWDVCCNHLRQVDALGLLVQYVDGMIVTGVCRYDDENLWRVLEWGLLNQSSLQKKRGMYLLECLIDAMPPAMARRWKRFVQVCTALDDTSLHLFNAHWSEMALLHPEEGSSEDRLPFFWIERTWRMAVTHQQPTAQKQALVSFLNRQWSVEDLRMISDDFLSTTLIPVLGQSSVYSGRHGDDVDEGIDRFFSALSDSRDSDESFCELIIPFLKALSDSQQQHVIMFCSRVIDIACERRTGSCNASGSFLELIGSASNAQRLFGSNYTGIVCHQSLMKLATMCLKVQSSSDMEGVLTWIGAIPYGLICKGGALHELGVSALDTILSRSDIDIESAIHDCVIHSGNALERTCARRIGALVKVLMLVCDTRHGILQALQKYIESDFLGQSDGDIVNTYCLISSMMEAFIPLDGKKLLSSNYSEYIISHCRVLSSEVLPKMVQNAMGKIGRLSPGMVERIYTHCIDKSLSMEENGLENIETLLPEDVYVYRETFALQLQTICNMTQAMLLASREGHIPDVAEALYGPLKTILVALVDKYRDIMSTSPEQFCDQNGEHQVSSALLNLARHCIFEIRILAMRLLVSAGESFRMLFRYGHNTIVEKSCIETIETMLMLSVQTLKDVYPSEAVCQILKSVQSLDQKKGKKKSKKQASVESWLALSSWRSIAACLACLEREHAGAMSPGIMSSIVWYGRYCLYTATDGEAIVIPIVRCFRDLIPILIQNWNLDEREKECMLTDGMEESLESILRSVSASLTHVMGNQTRRRLGLSAAVVSSVAHPFLFSSEALQDPKVAAMHLDGGAIHESICNLVSIGQNYNRLLIQLSCHIGSLLLENPKLGLQYRSVIEQLALSGFSNEASLHSLRDEVLDIATAQEVAHVMTHVPAAIATAFSQAECAPRVGVICLLYHWIQLALQKNEDAMDVCRMIWESLYSLSRNDKDLSHTVYTHGGPVHRKKIRLWQTLTILSPCIDSENMENQLKMIIEDMQAPNAQTVKQYQEIISATLVIRQPALVERLIFPEISDYTSQRKDANPCLFSIISVTISHFDQQSCQEAGEANHVYSDLFPSNMDHDTWNTLLMDSMDHILPWIGAFPHTTRTFAQVTVWNILKSYPKVMEGNPLLQRIAMFLDSNNDLKRLHARLGLSNGTLERFNVVDALQPSNVLCNPNNSLVWRPTKLQTCENAPLPLVQEMIDFLLEQRQNTRDKQSNVLKKAGEASFESGSVRKEVVVENEKNFWQRKITPKDQLQSALQMPWKHALGTSALRDNHETVHVDSFERLVYNTQPPQESNRQDIVVVASLIDRLPNLAGLTRTCEIFRAQKLILGDISIQDDPEFAAISVSANTWCPLEEVKPEHVCSWLEKMKRMGYRLVGLEQTDESVSLPEYTFDSKTVLMLGAEKEGIPANILNILDDTIEIPQLGIIRSLNVHVSAAITLYQYTCQQ